MKKLTALLLAGCMTISLAACSGNENPENTSTNTENLETEESSEESTEESSEESTEESTEESSEESAEGAGEAAGEDPMSHNPAVNLEGRVIKIGVNYDYIPDNTDFVVDPNAENYDPVTVQNTLDCMKRVEEKYNCKIQYVNIPYDQRIEGITNSVMTGDYIADYIGLDIGQILPLAANDLLYAWEDFASMEDDWATDQKYTVPAGKLFGKTYAINGSQPILLGDFVTVNNDIIDSLGLEATPLELYERGEWTWENFLEICKKATQDTDGDGKIDQWGLSGPVSKWCTMLCGSNNALLVDESSKTEMLSSPNTMEVFEFIDTLYNKEKVAMVVGEINEWDSNKDAFSQGKSAFYWAENWLLPPGDSRMPWEITILPCPKGPSGTDDKCWLQQMVGSCIPKGVADPEAVYHVVEDLSMPIDFDYESAVDVLYDDMALRITNEDDMDRVVEISTKMGSIDASAGIPGYPAWDVLAAMYDEGKTPAQAVESYKQIAQDAIDAILK